MINTFVQFAAEEAGQKSGIAVLGINPVGLLLQFITFLILFTLLKKFAFTPIIKALDERRKTIDKGVQLGQQMEAEQAKLETEIAKALHVARADADKIVASANKEASEIVKTAEDLAGKKAEDILKEAEAKIESATSAARKQLEHEMVSLVADATGAVIKEKVDAGKDAQLIRRSLEQARS